MKTPTAKNRALSCGTAIGIAASLFLSPASAAVTGASPATSGEVVAADAPVKLAKKKRRKRKSKKREGADTKSEKSEGSAGQSKVLYAKGIGFSVRPLTREEQQKFRRKGLLVSAIQKGLPADESGLRNDDIITSFDGKSVKDPAAFIRTLKNGDDGQTFKLLVVRSGVDTSVDLRLPGESAEEQDEREKKEQEEQDKKDEKEREERKEREQEEREDEAREDREREADEAREEAENEAEENEERLRELDEKKEKYDEAIEEVSEDKFGLLECLVCSFCLPTFTPVWIIVMLLVDNDTPTQRRHHDNGIPERADSEVTVVAY